jgi:hypothetical protein
MATKKFFFRYGTFLIKDGTYIHFWEDSWLGNSPLSEYTSREKAIAGAPKWLIPGAFWFASDLYADGNAYRWQILQFAGDNFFTAGTFGLCAGDNMLSLANL